MLLRASGTSLEEIGFASLLALPWGLKLLWAPWVERLGTARRWLLGLQGTAVAATLAVAWLDPARGLWAVALAVLVTNLVAATQDVATDGLAVSLLDEGERGLGNGLQVAGYRVGMIVGGSALLLVFDRWGWGVTLTAVAALLAVCTAPLLTTPEAGRAPNAGGASWRLSWDWLGVDGAGSWVAVLVAAKLGDYLVQGMLRPWLVDLGVGLDGIAALLGGVGFVAGLVGALLGGWLVGRLGRIPALVGFGLAQSAALGGYALLAAAGATGPWLWAIVALEHLVGGLATAALFTAMMDACRPGRGATDYTLQASVVVLASTAGATASGVVAGALGYAGVFAVGAAVSLALPLLAAREGWVRAVARAA